MSTCDRSDCCTGISVRTPVTATNPPGLDAVAHRVGEHADFFATMLARLSSPAHPALAGLTARTTDDPAIGLLDAAAVLADLLTFYTERIAAEGYLRTATEERSLVLLGRLVGHQPRPGVSAGTFLSYLLDEAAQREGEPPVVVPRGARAQSVPGPGEDPQSFETSEDLVARSSWNDLAVRTRRPYQLTIDDLDERESVVVAGVTTNLKPGDRLLYVFGTERDRQRLQIVSSVELDRPADVTVIGKPPAALPDLEELRQELRDLLDPILADDPADEDDAVIGRSVILRRFVADVLVPLRADVGDDTPENPGTLLTPTACAARLTEVLERLAEVLELATRYANVRAWLERLRSALAALRQQAGKLEPPQPQEESAGLFHSLGLDVVSPPGEQPRPPNPAVLGLGVLLGALRTPPARQPSSARQLRRDPAALFASGSDLGVQVLAALDPRVRDALYPAWRRIDLTAPLAVQELLAMRAVATPFGATAPLRAVPTTGGGVRQEEWQLEAPQLLGLKVFYDVATPDPDPDPDPDVEAEPAVRGTPSSAELVFELDANAWRETLDLSEDDRIDFGPGAVRHTTAESGTVTFAFEEHLPVHSVSLSAVATADAAVTVAFPGGWSPPIAGISLPPNTVRVTGATDPVTGRSTQIVARRVVPVTPDDLPFVEVVYTSSARIPANVLTLDAVYDGVGVGGWVVVERPRKRQSLPGDDGLALVTARVGGVRTVAKQAFGISGKVTELVLDRPWLDGGDTRLSQIRDTTIYLRGDPLRLADEPVLDDVAGGEIELAELHDGLAPGRWIVVSGERTDLPGSPAGVLGTELAMIAGVEQDLDARTPGDTVHTTIALAAPLAHRYRRDTVRIRGNVVRATHGASRDEPIGSGDASVPNQRFSLRQGPLTWLAADNPLGAESTLEIRVDGVRWHEVDSFAGRGPDERVHVVETDERGVVSVRFGDGVRGARLPTGVENVRARYRVGLGAVGNVGAGRITQLTTRPLGVSGVDNPLRATGGADPDDAGQLRRNIPLRVTAFDRLVSVSDHEDFARARAGIGRASARRLFDGSREIVHVTLAGVDDVPLEDDSDVVTALRAALAAHGDTGLPVVVAVREPVLLVVSANVRVLPDHTWEVVEPAVRAALLARLGFRNRELGQPAHLSEVLATAQAVPGVDHVDVDVFAGVPGGITPVELDRLADRLAAPNPVVPARPAVFEVREHVVTGAGGQTLTAVAAENGITVAQLLRLNPDITDASRLPSGRRVVVFRGVRPAQLAMLFPAVPDTLILREVRP
ncbi:putative baseplate assembly protein [Umezawaea beigongshangensis]|uniref:putative baseplate assembly protein n=1 Tax=Umezawaea beigongshangensis TaxID=2780383 RepID=UPI0018F26736|nr:putative baseplate assembly protein [Umezawaea beigongshangensis]